MRINNLTLKNAFFAITIFTFGSHSAVAAGGVWVMRAHGLREKVSEYASSSSDNHSLQESIVRISSIGYLEILVNDAGDTHDVNLRDGACVDPLGRCTFRSAIEQISAARAGRIIFSFNSATIIDLTLGPLSLDPINGEIIVEGPGAALLTLKRSSVAGTPEFRIFEISAHSHKVTLRGLTIANGRSSSEGGCLYVPVGGSMSLDQTVIQNCRADHGGGISTRGTLTVNCTTVRNNSAFLGGGIFVGEEGSLLLKNSTVNNNAGSQGGGINNNGDYSEANMINTTISGNSTSGGEYPHGGGILTFGPLRLINATISGNSGAVNAGGIADWASVWGVAPTELRNTIVAANIGPALMDIYSYGLVSRGNNLVGTGPIYGLTHGVNGDIVGTYAAPIAPGLGPLGNNGGSTATQQLSSDSPAINSGNNCVILPPENGGCAGEALVSDQRGQGSPRKIGAYVDIGAFESDSVLQRRGRFDFDGDGRSDVSVFRPSNQAWYIDRSTQGFSAVQFGLATDKLAPADYDGDGKTDISIFRDGTWWRINSGNNTVEAITFGTTGDIPVPADYTGDGRDDLGFYRNGQWWTLDLSNGQTSVVNFGISTDKPIPADYDADGKADQAVYRGGEWHLHRSALGYAVRQFGIPTDSPVVGDYDGDGISDLAVYRNGTWYIDYSAHGPNAFQWGIATDIPAPADYDGDGKTDAAIFRDGTWWLRQTTSGTTAVQFGLAGDKPIPSALLP